MNFYVARVLETTQWVEIQKNIFEGALRLWFYLVSIHMYLVLKPEHHLANPTTAKKGCSSNVLALL